MRKIYIGVTDDDWFRFLSNRPHLDEVNFWQPGGTRVFKTLLPGEPFLFKLHAPYNFIVGGGFFAHASLYPVSLAWEAFGEKNGVGSYQEMRRRIERLRRATARPGEDYSIGCVILQDPFFLRSEDWIPVPASFSLNIVAGKSYDLGPADGRALWDAVLVANAKQTPLVVAEPKHNEWWPGDQPMFEEGVLGRRRLGQGTFRLVVTDTYERRCAVTGERTLIVLDAAHIRPVTSGGLHRIDNGLLLRSDVHRLFDRGYVTVTPDYRFRVSPRLKTDWENGRVYYDLDHKLLRLPRDPTWQPDRAALEWHADTVFLR